MCSPHTLADPDGPHQAAPHASTMALKALGGCGLGTHVLPRRRVDRTRRCGFTVGSGAAATRRPSLAVLEGIRSERTVGLTAVRFAGRTPLSGPRRAPAEGSSRCVCRWAREAAPVAGEAEVEGRPFTVLVQVHIFLGGRPDVLARQGTSSPRSDSNQQPSDARR